MEKLKAAIIGTGNIGTDLLVKLQRSKFLQCTLFSGRNRESNGIKKAQSLGVNISFESIQAIEKDPGCCDIVFDATSAETHRYHAPILRNLNKFVIDLTPSRVGKMCVPVLNLQECLSEKNVNTITCGGQATSPIAHAITKIHPETKYIEIVASIASKSAGSGTRANIDEFTQTTRDALARFTGIEHTKAIIILNPANPPIIMRNTIYALIDDPDMEQIKTEVKKYVAMIQEYVPGYRMVVEPILQNGRVSTTVEVVGLGDFLPQYSGNLDIITCASIKIAEEYAKKYLSKAGGR